MYSFFSYENTQQMQQEIYSGHEHICRYKKPPMLMQSKVYSDHGCFYRLDIVQVNCDWNITVAMSIFSPRLNAAESI